MSTGHRDEYPTCAETYSTFIVYSDLIDPDEVTKRLGIMPTEVCRKGHARNPGNPNSFVYKRNMWGLSTRCYIDSRDTRRHLDWLLARLSDKALEINELVRLGAEVTISAYWASASGQGGPMITPEQSSQLGELGIELWYDVYFYNEDDNHVDS